MFEDQQDAVNRLLETSEKFKRMYDQHRELKDKVHDASIGVMPLDDFSLERLKKEKLLLKDRMADILRSHQGG
ncbi:MAG TPA: DUF465 domain-containing protein [Sedimenticola sp.]|nr:DUF465 domain-containing protein [Sedimenticola sp.]